MRTAMKMRAMTMKAKMMKIGGLVLGGHKGATEHLLSQRSCLPVSQRHLQDLNASFSLHSTSHHHRHTTPQCSCATLLLHPLHPLTCFPYLTLQSRAHQMSRRALRHVVQVRCLSHLLCRGKNLIQALVLAVLSPLRSAGQGPFLDSYTRWSQKGHSKRLRLPQLWIYQERQYIPMLGLPVPANPHLSKWTEGPCRTTKT